MGSTAVVAVFSGILAVLGIVPVSRAGSHVGLDIREGAIGCEYRVGSVVGEASPTAPSVLVVYGASSGLKVSVVYRESSTVNRVPCGTSGVINSWRGIAG